MRRRYSPKMSLKRSTTPQESNPGGRAGTKRAARRILASPKRMVMAFFVMLISAMLIFVAVGITWTGQAGRVIGGSSALTGRLINVDNGASGPGGSAWGFRNIGGRSFVAIQDRGLYHPHNQTYSGWVRFDGRNGWNTIYWKGNPRDCHAGCRNRENALFFMKQGNTGYFHLTSTQVGRHSQNWLNSSRIRVTPRRWHYFTTVVSPASGRMAIYLDGRRIGQRGIQRGRPIINSHWYLFVGTNNPGRGHQLHGAVDEFSFYPGRHMTDAGAAALYRSAKARSNRSAGTSASSGGSNNALLGALRSTQAQNRNLQSQLNRERAQDRRAINELNQALRDLNRAGQNVRDAIRIIR